MGRREEKILFRYHLRSPSGPFATRLTTRAKSAWCAARSPESVTAVLPRRVQAFIFTNPRNKEPVSSRLAFPPLPPGRSREVEVSDADDASLRTPLPLRRRHGRHHRRCRPRHRRHHRRCHRHHHQLPHSRCRPRLPAPHTAAGKPTLPSSSRASSNRARASSLPPCVPPAASLATQSPPTAPAPAGLWARLPHPALPHASAALAWQAVAVQMGLAVGSRGGGWQVAKARMAFCRSLGISF